MSEFYKRKWSDEPPGIPGIDEDGLQGDSAETQAIVSDLFLTAAAVASASASPVVDDTEEAEGEGDEDEDAMRAALLQSMAQKKKQKIKTKVHSFIIYY